MSIPLNINGSIVEFPSSAQSPNWAPAVIQFAELVALALSSVVGPFDVVPQIFTLDSYNPGTNISVNNLAFPTSSVRSAIITYNVHRTTSDGSVSESGEIEIVYDVDNPTNNKWEIAQERVGDASISFTITDAGQVQFSTSTLSGTDHSGQLAFSAKALLQDYT